MFKRLTLTLVSKVISDAILEYVQGITKITRRNDTILMLIRMKEHLENSSSKLKRTVGSILPFERED